MKTLKFITSISAILFFLTSAWSGYHLSSGANLLLNGNLTGNLLTQTEHAFLGAHISVMYSAVFAVITAILVLICAFAQLGEKNR